MHSSAQVVLTGSQFRANDNQATDVAVRPADGELQPHVTKSACQLQRRPKWSARIGIKGDIVDAIGALHSNGIGSASARADMPQTALPSPTELQDGEGGCEPRAAEAAANAASRPLIDRTGWVRGGDRSAGKPMRPMRPMSAPRSIDG